MKILMIGLGSIGQRHVRNLRRLYGDEVELMAYRSRGLKRTFTDKLEVREGVDLEAEYGIRAYTSLEEALAQKPEVAFITNITAKHMDCALACAKAGCHLFIEKPLSHDMEGIEELKRLCEDQQLVVFMGFQNRYHLCVREMKKVLEEGVLGQITYGDCEFAERVSTMHRYEDYKDTYMARSDMGGGPVGNLLMHDLDILAWLFGKPASVSATTGNSGVLGIDVEESASGVFSYKGTEGGVIPAQGSFQIRVHTDFYQFPPVHAMKIIGTKGRAEADLLSGRFTLYLGDEKVREEHYDFPRNDMFLKELQDFRAALRGEKAPEISLEAGITALEMGLGMKGSAAAHGEIRF